MNARLAPVAMLLLLSTARADLPVAAIAEELSHFSHDTRAFMDERPTRFHPGGAPWLGGNPTPFQAKLQLRRMLTQSRGGTEPLAEPSSDDQAGAVVDKIAATRLEEMLGIQKASVPVAPWSGDYWAVYKGGLAKRYADPRFPANKDWKVNYDFLSSHLGEPTPIELMSPAEKYDLLVGDSDWSLSRQMQEVGWQYYSGPKTVPTWVGYCHGWAIAAYEVPRPSLTVEATAPDGRTIPFYPDDIKALETALWGDYALSYPIRFTGGRCETEEPAEDSSGRIVDPTCFDTNPATWHLAVVNQIGVARKSMTFDASLDNEVWNQPILGYEYTYFNPQTLLPALTLADATVPIGNFSSDRFKAYRSGRARSVVGIAMELTYLDEIKPSNKPIDTQASDERVTVRYLYDLELDARGNIIGGEWYRNRHPDFLWTPLAGARPWTSADSSIDAVDPGGTWDGASPLPSSWLPYLPGTSAQGIPAAHIVEALSARSRTVFP